MNPASLPKGRRHPSTTAQNGTYRIEHAGSCRVAIVVAQPLGRRDFAAGQNNHGPYLKHFVTYYYDAPSETTVSQVTFISFHESLPLDLDLNILVWSRLSGDAGCNLFG